MVETNIEQKQTKKELIWRKATLPREFINWGFIPDDSWELKRFGDYEVLEVADLLMRFEDEFDPSFNVQERFIAYSLSNPNSEEPDERYLLLEQHDQLWAIDIHDMELSSEED